MKNPAERGYYRPDSAAKYLSISRAALYALLSSGELKSRRLGGCRLIAKSDMDALVASKPLTA